MQKRLRIKKFANRQKRDLNAENCTREKQKTIKNRYNSFARIDSSSNNRTKIQLSIDREAYRVEKQMEEQGTRWEKM